MNELERRLRRALAQTSDAAPRPVVPIELPLRLERIITPRLLKKLRPASVLVPVMRRAGGLQVLLTVRADTLRAHGGQISFPGGRREPSDVTAAGAALREAEEEVGLPVSAVEIVGYLDDYPTLTKYLVTPVVGMVEDVREVRPCAREVAEIFEVPLEFLVERANYERNFISNKGLRLPYFEVNYGRYRIWGATAGMLWNLAQKVAGDEA